MSTRHTDVQLIGSTIHDQVDAKKPQLIGSSQKSCTHDYLVVHGIPDTKPIFSTHFLPTVFTRHGNVMRKVFNMQFNLFMVKMQPFLMPPLNIYAIEDCLFFKFPLNPALLRGLIYYDNMLYTHKMTYHWKEEHLISYSIPLVNDLPHFTADQ